MPASARGTPRSRSRRRSPSPRTQPARVARSDDRRARATGAPRPTARTPGSTGCSPAARASPDRCARSPSRPRRLRGSLLLGRVDADAVRVLKTGTHDLGRLRLAVDETDPAHRPLRAGADALARDRDPDVGVVESAVGPDAEAERRPGREGRGAQNLAGGGLQDRPQVAAVCVVLVDDAAD